jgi:hypothetical protein
MEVSPLCLGVRDCRGHLFKALSIVLAMDLVVRIILLKFSLNEIVEVLFGLGGSAKRNRRQGKAEGTRHDDDAEPLSTITT